MSIAFTRSMRSLSRSPFRRATLGLLASALILALWIACLIAVRISIYETSKDARLETETAAHPIEAPVSGRITRNHLTVGQHVRAGQVLVELDAQTVQLQLQEEQTQPAGLAAQILSLDHEIDSEEQALREAQESGEKAIQEAQAQLREATARAQFARIEAERLDSLHHGGVISELDFLRVKANAQEREAVADRMRIAIDRLDREHRTAERDRRARLERLKGEVARVKAQISTGEATLERLKHEVERRQIQAPISGRIGAVADLRIGAVVAEGTKFGAIIPDGGIRAIAYFPPQEALGRIQPGQSALIRLEGFPESQHRSLTGTVVTVAGELNDGRVRVELKVQPNQISSISIQHGMPGTVEIEVQKASPIMLISRYFEALLVLPDTDLAPQ